MVVPKLPVWVMLFMFPNKLWEMETFERVRSILETPIKVDGATIRGIDTDAEILVWMEVDVEYPLTVKILVKHDDQI